MKKIVLSLFLLAQVPWVVAQGWVQTMNGYANEIDCGSANQVVIEGTMPMGGNNYQSIFRKNGTNWDIYSTTHTSFQNSYRPGVAADGTIWASLFDGVGTFGATKNNTPLNVNMFYMSVRNSQSALMTGLSGNNNVFLINETNSGTWLPGTTNLNFRKAVMGFDGSIFGITQANTSTPNGTTNVYKYENETWTPINAIGALVATDISVGDANKVLVVSDGKIFYLDQASSPNRWRQDFTVPAGEVVKRVSIATDGTAYMLTHIDNPDIFTDNNIYNTTWNLINPCATASAPSFSSGNHTEINACSGDDVEMSLHTSGGGTFDWYDAPVGGNLIHTGATYNTGVLTETTIYYVERRFTNCSTGRTAFTVNVDAVATINAHPQPAELCAGGDFTLTVEATGNDLSYQWKLNGVDIDGETSSTLSVSNATTANQGDYSVVVSSTCNDITSNVAAVTVNQHDIVIQEQPQAVMFCAGQDFDLSISYTGNVSGVQWYKDGVAIPDAVSSSLTIQNPTAENNGEYYVVLTHASGCSFDSETVVVSGEGISHFYSFEDGTANDVFNLNNGTLIGTNAFQPTQDRFNNEAALRNTQQNGSAININDISSNAITVSMWIKPSSIANSPNLIHSDNTTSARHLAISSNGRLSIQRTSVSWTESTNGNGEVALDEWSHVVWMVEGNAVKVYLNGLLAIDEPNAAVLNPAQNPVSRFMNNANVNIDQGFVGAFDEIKIFKNTLDEASIKLLGGFDPSMTTSYSNACGPLNEVTLSAPLVEGAGLTGVEYQWFENNTAVSGATSDELFVANPSTASYKLVAKKGCIAVTSPEISVEILQTTQVPEITTQPVAQAGCTGADLSLNVDASGNNLSYQWFKDGNSIEGANSSSLPLTNANASNAGDYYVEVSNSFGCSVQSDVVQVSINSDGLLHYYSFNDGTASDLNGSNNGTVVGSISQAGDRFSQLRAMNANNTSSTIDIADVDANGSLTVTMWIRPQLFFNTPTLIHSDIPNTPRHLAIMSGGNLSIQTDTETRFTTEVLAVEQWAHVAWVTDANSTKLYLNGELVIDEPSKLTNRPVSRFMNDPNLVSGFRGQFDDIQLFSDALSAEEIRFIAGFTPTQQTEAFAPCQGTDFKVETSWFEPTSQDVTYQWYKGATPVVGATAKDLVLNNVTASDAGEYTLHYSLGGCFSYESTPITVTVGSVVGAQITTQPVDTDICSNIQDPVAIFVQATGNNLTYQWFKDGQPMQGQTGSFIYLNGNTNETGAYYVEITSACGVTTSATANVTVEPSPAIESFSPSSTVCEGQSVTLEVSATGSDLTYEWLFEGTPISGATSNQLSIANVTASNSGGYSVVVSNACGEATSAVSQLSVASPLNLVSGLSDATSCEGEDVTLSAQVVGDLTTISWRKDGNPIANSTLALSLSNVTVADEGIYRLTLGGACGDEIISEATLSLTPNTVITAVSPAVTICEGDNTTLTVEASGQNLSYQWLKDGAPLAGAMDNNLNVEEGGSYSVEVSGTCGTAVSQAISVTVIADGMIFEVNQEICFGQTLDFNGNQLVESGQYTETFTSTAGCDSVVVLNLTVLAEIDVTVAQEDHILTATQPGASYQWVDCNNGNAIIDGATNQAFTASENGSYAVIITVNDCEEISACYEVNTLSVDKFEQFNLSIYPNPSTGKFTIETSQATTITIVDAVGKVLLVTEIQEGANPLSLEGAMNGVYFVQFNNGETQQVQRVVINY